MCSICGIFAPRGAGLRDCAAIRSMSATLAHRGPDASGGFSSGCVSFHHNRLAVVDLTGGSQPMTVLYGGKSYTIVYNGELYNTADVTRELAGYGVTPATRSDTEAVVYAYAVWGEDCPRHLNGIFAFSVYDAFEGKLFCCRDPLGVKPFFYTLLDGKFLFASEIKALLKYPGISPVLDARGLWELLFLSPTIPPESGIFRDIHQLGAGMCCIVDAAGMHSRRWWAPEAKPFTGDRREAVETVRELLTDAIRRQLISDVPLCCFLSGGLDSSIVCAVAAQALRDRGETLATYSFEYEGNTYAPTLFQPNPDDRYACLMAEYIGSDHTVLTAPSQAVADALIPAAVARDYPGQADIDSSLWYYCREVKRRHTVALSGECADEIFGGYPWFYRPEMLGRDFFPWIHDPWARIRLFREEITRPEEGYAYLSGVYRATVDAAPVLDGEGEEDRRARIATTLSVGYFMSSLLERKDRMSMAHALEVRVPFSDPRILSYVYNVPWHIKFEGGVEKSLLREAMAPYLPDFVLHRKKSPYPKTHNPAYERIVRDMLVSRLSKEDSPLARLLKPHALDAVTGGGDITWLGQLMSRPQLYAWLVQFDDWMRRYDVRLSL